VYTFVRSFVFKQIVKTYLFAPLLVQTR